MMTCIAVTPDVYVLMILFYNDEIGRLEGGGGEGPKGQPRTKKSKSIHFPINPLRSNTGHRVRPRTLQIANC